MDFRNTSDLICQGQITQDEVITQILNLPCIYTITNEAGEIFSLQVINQSNDEEIQVPLLYSNLEIAIEAVKEFQTPQSWEISQWIELYQVLNTCQDEKYEGIAFDSLPQNNNLQGLVIDKSSVEELLNLSLAN